MATAAKVLSASRRAAWAFGRAWRDDLLARFCSTYHLSAPPPPALVIDELLTDFMGVRLRFDPLPLTRFAQTRIRDGITTITINSNTFRIPGVKDVLGIQKVGMCHEGIHVVRDSGLLQTTDQPCLPGFDGPQQLTCYRAGVSPLRGDALKREFWAEEAGRAAAVSHEALAQSPAFGEFWYLARRDPVTIPGGWSLLYEAAADIYVNRSALITQLSLEGHIVVTQENGRHHLRVPPSFLDDAGGVS